MAITLPMTHEEANAASAAAADQRETVAEGMRAAAKDHPADKFARNAATKPWAEGFDQKLGAKRTTT